MNQLVQVVGLKSLQRNWRRSSEKHLPQRHFVHHKSHMDCSVTEPTL
jgi:hypothetical protein